MGRSESGSEGCGGALGVWAGFGHLEVGWRQHSIEARASTKEEGRE